MKHSTPFSTRLSGSARETELRLRSIFRWKKKRPPAILLVLMLAITLGCGGLVAWSEPGWTDEVEEDHTLRQEVIVEQTQLQAVPAPLLEKVPAAIKTLEYDGMWFMLHQPADEDIYYHLAVTVAGKDYDLGRVGYGSLDMIGNSLIQRTGISAADTIYALIRQEDLDLTQTTYFAIRDQVPVLLCSIPGIGRQVDVDGDGQVETISNCGLPTWPNQILYEWQMDENEFYCADLRQQLGSDTIVFDDEEMCFLAGKKADSGWQYDRYQYQGAWLEKANRT